MAQKTTREFWVSDNVEDAVRKTKLTLKKLGELTAVVPGQHVVGNVAFGVQQVALQIAWRPEEVETKTNLLDTAQTKATAKNIGTLLLMEASVNGRGETGNDAAMHNAFERFEDAYLHFDRADYTPDRVGLLPVTVIGILVLMILAGVFIARKTNWFKPVPQPSPSISIGAPSGAP
ncbi:MAG: hypothetical protein H7Y38_13840 [Armatimonadetes bacterium]|nr:hypothetical protein [Armatimonadota bacterium]